MVKLLYGPWCPPPQCVTCQMSCVTCHVSHVACHLSFFFLVIGEAYWWRVWYQQGLPRLVFSTIWIWKLIREVSEVTTVTIEAWRVKTPITIKANGQLTTTWWAQKQKQLKGPICHHKCTRISVFNQRLKEGFVGLAHVYLCRSSGACSRDYSVGVMAANRFLSFPAINNGLMCDGGAGEGKRTEKSYLGVSKLYGEATLVTGSSCDDFIP